MDIDKLHQAAQRPPLYEKGDAEMWTDAYISRQLLEIHLNPEIDSATRTPVNIQRTLQLIRDFCRKPRMDILDLGCGPGFYLEQLARLGHRCTGVDFSENSIAYATRQAKEKGLDITYMCQNYLELDFENQFDLVLLIYTDLGVLLPGERSRLLKKIHRALRPEGIFIFDVVNERNGDRKFREDSTWTYNATGFWRSGPYMEVASSFHYPEARVFLRQHTIMDESDTIRNYRFWMHYFSAGDMEQILSEHGFSSPGEYDRVLQARDEWSGENISFFKTQKEVP
jgi:2-polyprenyl-3-methyl-5-hydroxy-6-metoxy-1,4-benzoquinol methylase